MEETKQVVKEPKKLADGIYEGDLLVLDLGEGKFFRGWASDLLLTNEGFPFALRLGAEIIELEKIKTVLVGEIQYVKLEDRIKKIKEIEEIEEKAKEASAKEVQNV